MKRRRFLLALALFLVLALAVIGATRASSQTPSSDLMDVPAQPVPDALADATPCPSGGCGFVPGQLLVKLRPDMVLVAPKGRAPTAGAESLNAIFQAQDVTEAVRVFPAARKPPPGARKQIDGVERPVPDLSRWYKFALPRDADILKAVAAFKADPSVEHAEPNYIFTFDTTPNDPYFAQQWHLHNTGQYYLTDADIDAPEAWDIVTGTETVVIAVIDTGIDRDHPDLDDHIWSNPGETPDNGVDDDGNGYTDDTWGWNWASDYPTDPDDFHPNDPRDDNGHGTHVAGIAAAETNNGVGVAGVCWNCKVMSLKAFESNGTGTTSDIVQAINYAAGKGADVINMSFGSYAESLLLEDTLADAYGQSLLVAAAGNGIRGKGTNQPFYPAAISYVLGVGASDVQCVQRDPITLECLLIAEAKAPFSNYGVNSDVCAPGVSIYSTYPGSYASMAGTSMAAPIVSGLAGLMMGHFPTWSKEAFRGQIINTTDAIYVGPGFPACGSGRVNGYSALTVVPVPDLSLLTDSIEYGDATGDGDGIPDAGETMTVTMLLKDYWSEATNVVGTLSTSDPYVTLLDTAGSWGDISAYATMRNGADPFQFSLHPDAPNNHEVVFQLDLNSNGGSYSKTETFPFLVQRGVEIPHPLFPAIITQSMTLHSDYLYIVKQNMLVQQGVTLTIEPGTRLQFDPGKFIKIQGTLIASGTAELPIVFTSNQKEPQPGDFKGIIFDDQATDAVLDPNPITTTIATEGSAIPGIGTVVSITNAPHFDDVGDVFFSATIDGSPDEQVLHWFNGVGLIEVSGDPLPTGSSTTPFSETVYLLNNGSYKSVVFTEPSIEYQSGSILNHIVLEYGGGLLIDDSFPYIANSIFRQNEGAIPAGTDQPYGAIVVDRQEQVDSHALVIYGNTISDNPSHGLFVSGYGPGQLSFFDNVVWNNVPESPVLYKHSGAGLILYNGDLATNVRGNSIQYNRASNCGGLHVYKYSVERLRFEANDLRNNEAFQNSEGAGGGGGCMDFSSGLIRRNTIANNIQQEGYEPGNAAYRGKGSALDLNTSAPVMQFNTIAGNEARPGLTPRTAAGHTFFFMWHQASQLAHLTRNNIVGNQASFDLFLSNYGDLRQDVDATQNFWDTTDGDEIRYDRIYDYWQDFDPGEAFFQPFLTAPEPLAPGFLWQATTYPPDPIGAETMTVTLDFSRDMNTAITPTVTFGVDEPFTKNRIESGQWASPTRWVGAYQVEVWTGDGINTLKVSDAEDTDGMPIPEDTRFQFVIQVAGTSAMLLEGDAGLGYAHLTWPESDIEDLAGYVIYRSPLTNTNYSPIATLLSTTYTDTKVINSQLYYYKYAILNTDFEETAESNEIALVPDDFTDPTTPVVTDDGAWTHLFTQLHATWSASDPETGIVEYQYCIGTAVGACDTVGWTSLGLATEVTRTGLNLQDGETYYFNVKARNGAGHWSAVGSSDGITVDKLPAPAISTVQPLTGVRTQSHVIAISGSNFATPTVKLDNTLLGGVVMNTSDWLSATVPSGIAAGAYTLTVTNYDTQWAMLTDAYTATNPAHPVAPVSVSPASGTVGTDEASYTVNIEVGTVSDLGHFQFDLLFEPAVVQVSSVNLGWFLGSGGRSTATVGPDIDNTTGIVTFGGYSYGSNPGASGSGTLATVTFTPVAQGSSALALQNVQLIDTVDGAIPVQLNDGQVQVVVYPTYDFDRDCEVTVLDIMQVASRWNTHTGDPGYDPAYDLDSDGDIDIADIAMVANAWGETCSGGGSALAAVGMATTGPALRFNSGQALRLLPERATARPGDLLTFDLTVSDVADLGAYQVTLEYDPTSLEVVEVQPGPMLAAAGNSVVNLEAMGEGGEVNFGAFSYGDRPGATGDGILARITLRVLKPGEHALALRRAYLVDMAARSLALSEIGEAVVDAGYRLHLPLLNTQH